MRIPRTFPLGVQLLAVLVAVVVATTLALTVTAYRASVTTLEATARASVRLAADTRDQTITSVVSSARQSLEGVLASARSLCGEELDRGRTAWAVECVSPLIHEFRATQRARGVLAAQGTRVLVRSGEPLSPVVLPAGTLARIVTTERGGRLYQIGVSDAGLTLTAEFVFRDVAALFGHRSVLGTGGEVLLLDREGRFLTPPAHESTNPANEPLLECLEGDGELIGPDYRGVPVFHAFHPVEALGVCVDAHIPVDEALAPAMVLRDALVRWSALFILAGALLSLMAAHWVAAPVRRLAAAAAQVQRGDFNQAITLAGPSEVRSLSIAFRTMADHLARLVAREQAARKDAEAANAAKDRFLAMVSHELRTTLTAVLGWIRLARLHRLREADVERALAAIERGAGSQQRLVDDLLDVSRIARGQMHLRLEAIPLADAVQAAVDSLRPQAEDSGVHIHAALEGTVAVRGDAERLQQVAANLISNALKFTPPGGSISVQVRGAVDVAVLIVNDTGPGISPDLLPHVFEWFRQGDLEQTHRQSGLGLGLGIVKQLVELHGGHVTVDSLPGRGATFTVTLPLAAAASAAASLSKTPGPSVLSQVEPGPLDIGVGGFR